MHTHPYNKQAQFHYHPNQSNKWEKYKQKYRFFGTVGASAEGAEKKDSQGTAEENAGGGLEKSRVVKGGKNEGNWEGEFNGALLRRRGGCSGCDGGCGEFLR